MWVPFKQCETELPERSCKNMWSHVTHNSTLATLSIPLRVKAKVVRVAHMVCLDLSPYYFSSSHYFLLCSPPMLTDLYFLSKREILLPQIICITIFSAGSIPSFALNVFSAGITLTYLWCKLFLRRSTPFFPDFNFFHNIYHSLTYLISYLFCSLLSPLKTNLLKIIFFFLYCIFNVYYCSGNISGTL